MFREIEATAIEGNPIQMLKNAMLITAQDASGRVNMMTGAWGGIGNCWGRPIAFCMIRHKNRYTHQFVDSAETFSLSFYDDAWREQLTLCGTKSGRDIDKVAACGFDLLHEGDTPYFKQARLVMICRKILKQRIDVESILAPDIIQSFYSGNYEGNYHHAFIGEITKVLLAE